MSTTTSKLGLYTITIWLAYVVLSPVYIFPKGLPQPADIILLAGMLPALAILFLNPQTRIPLPHLIGGLFAALTLIINWTNFAFIPDKRLLLSGLYYPYNLLTFTFIAHIFRQNTSGLSNLTHKAIALSIIIQFAWAVLYPDPGAARITAGFSNPNQLAYWSLLSAAILFFLKRSEKLSLFDLLLLFMVGYIQTLSLSKAGIITYILFIFCLSFTPQFPKLGRLITILSALAIAIYALTAPATVTNLMGKIDALERASARLETIGKENDDSLEGRGYNRIINHPEYLIIGAGEGGFARFRTSGSPNELHSGLATILFSYGILGLGFFTAFLASIFYRQPWYCTAILLCILLFSISSQTIRFTHTWVFLAIAYATFIPKRPPQPPKTHTNPETELPHHAPHPHQSE